MSRAVDMKAFVKFTLDLRYHGQEVVESNSWLPLGNQIGLRQKRINYSLKFSLQLAKV